MIITKERTRLLFTEYTPDEKKIIEDLVASMDTLFLYLDPDDKMIGLPPGMENTVRKLFRHATFIDNSKRFWEYAHITPVEHNSKPRNQLQVDFIKFLLENADKHGKVAGILSPGTGKATPLSTLIASPNGYKRMGDLVIGDKIFGSDGKQYNVTGVFPQGVKDVYEITFSDGRKARCCKEHLWEVYHTCTSSTRTVELQDMIKDYKKYTPSKNDGTRDPYIYKYRIPLLSNPVQYDEKPVPIDPYVLGAFIGDGCCMSRHQLTISSPDSFIPNKIAKICGFIVKKINNSIDWGFYKLVKGKGLTVVHTKEFFSEVFDEVVQYSYDKRIPDVYMYNSLDIRMELLRGLLDTDGTISIPNRYNISFNSCSPRLLEQVRELILGLGFIANISYDKRTWKYTNNMNGTVNIRVPNRLKKEFFTYPQKYKRACEAYYRNDHQQPFRHLLVKDIRKIGREECQCIMVDSPDHLYLTEDFIVTHNTFMACYAAIKVGLRTLIIVPTSSIKKQWAETLINMFNVSPDRVVEVKRPKDFINTKADFVVVSQASLSVLNKTYDLEKIMQNNKFGIKVIDEVQMWFHNIIKVDANSNIANNWYLTGTFGRSGQRENDIYQEMFGDLNVFEEKQKKPTIFNRKPGNIYGMKPHTVTKMIWSNSGLSPEERKKCMNSMRYSEREEKWIRYGISIPSYTELVIPADGHETKWINLIRRVFKMSQKEINYGKTLILTSTVAACDVIADYIKKDYPDLKVGCIYGKNGPQLNAKIKVESDVIVSTYKSAGTGFDVKDLSRLITTIGWASWILSSQIRGRLRVRDDGKKTYMYDLADNSIRQLRSWANMRADVLRRESLSFNVIDM